MSEQRYDRISGSPTWGTAIGADDKRQIELRTEYEDKQRALTAQYNLIKREFGSEFAHMMDLAGVDDPATKQAAVNNLVHSIAARGSLPGQMLSQDIGRLRDQAIQKAYEGQERELRPAANAPEAVRPRIQPSALPHSPAIQVPPEAAPSSSPQPQAQAQHTTEQQPPAQPDRPYSRYQSLDETHQDVRLASLSPDQARLQRTQTQAAAGAEQRQRPARDAVRPSQTQLSPSEARFDRMRAQAERINQANETGRYAAVNETHREVTEASKPLERSAREQKEADARSPQGEVTDASAARFERMRAHAETLSQNQSSPAQGHTPTRGGPSR